eukprot:1140681_1
MLSFLIIFNMCHFFFILFYIFFLSVQQLYILANRNNIPLRITRSEATMSPLQSLLAYLCLLFQNAQSNQNLYTKLTGSNGEDIWKSTSWFQQSGAISYGTIKIGQVMVMEFDFRYLSRVNSPTPGAIESFFRIGHTGTGGGCSEGTRYPSLWLDDNTQNDNGPLVLSYSSGDTCDVSKTLWNYPQVSKLADTSIWTHIIITIDWTTVTIELTGGDKVDKTYSWNREITKKADLGDEVPVWFGSDGGWNIGNCKLRNIVITSSVFTYSPTPAPTANPTPAPTDIPTSVTFYPSNAPTLAPSSAPTSPPSSAPSLNPTLNPSLAPTTTPSATPTQPPTFSPTLNPSLAPSQPPTAAPSQNPSATPSQPPTKEPSAIPTTPPSNQPSMSPTLQPTHPTSEPTGNPTPEIPTIANPSKSPTRNPSEIPSPNPSSAPTSAPTLTPTFNPSKSPSQSPSIAPSGAPTVTRNPTPDPTAAPSSAPSAPPTKNPSASPSSSPSSAPSNNPSLHPTTAPSAAPSKDPSVSPTTDAPTEHPSSDPTKRPSLSPTQPPTAPTNNPTLNPTSQPLSAPSEDPTIYSVTSVTSDLTKQSSLNPTVESKRGQNMKQSSIVYIAIGFVCVFLIVVAVYCYCKSTHPEAGVCINHYIPVKRDSVKHPSVPIHDQMTRKCQSEGEVALARTDNRNHRKLSAECKDPGDELVRINSMYYLEWTHSEVVDWILSIDNGKYAQYEQELRVLFAKESVNGAVLSEISKTDLRDWGIQNFSHRSNIFNQIQILVNKHKQVMEGIEGQDNTQYI